MRITEKRLRSIISEVIDEMSHMIPQEEEHVQGVGHDITHFMDKAEACCKMSADRLSDMCEEIIKGNPAQARHCAKLCICVGRGDMRGCCECLSKICECGHCAETCAQYCGC